MHPSFAPLLACLLVAVPQLVHAQVQFVRTAPPTVVVPSLAPAPGSVGPRAAPLPQVPPGAPSPYAGYASPVPSGYSLVPQGAFAGNPVPPSTAIPLGAAEAAQTLSVQSAAALGAQSAQVAAVPVPAEQVAQQTAAYFTNGAEVTAAPTTGPAAAYFNNATSVLGVPTSVVPFAPETTTAAPEAPLEAPPPAPPPVAVYVVVPPAAAPAPEGVAPPGALETVAPSPPATAPAPPAIVSPPEAATPPAEAPPQVAPVATPQPVIRPSFPTSLSDLVPPPAEPHITLAPVTAAPVPGSPVAQPSHRPIAALIVLPLLGLGVGIALTLLVIRLARHVSGGPLPSHWRTSGGI